MRLSGGREGRRGWCSMVPDAARETGAGGPVLIGPANQPRRGAPARLSRAQRLSLSGARSRRRIADAEALIERYARERRPTCRWPCARRSGAQESRARSNWRAALGMVRIDAAGSNLRCRDRRRRARPASATAVYAASEGLSVIVFDAQRVRRTGRRERPHRELSWVPDRHFRPGAGRPRLRAGAEVWRRDGDSRRGQRARLRSTLRSSLELGRRHAASRPRRSWWRAGARYRRPAIPNLEQFEGRGVWYWASPIEARLCRQEEVALVGGGNSAGQAAVFLSRLRREGLDAGARRGASPRACRAI